MRKIKYLCIIIAFVCLLFKGEVYASEASNFTNITTLVDTLCNNGELEEFHRGLSYKTSYQTLFDKMYLHADDNSKEAFKKMPYSNIISAIESYENEWDSLWYDVLTNLDVEAETLDPNRILGIYYDADAEDNASYLYLLWTSHYVPTEFYTVNEITVNDKTYKQYPTGDLFDPFWYDSSYYHFPEFDITLHKTPIAGYEFGEAFGIPLAKKYKFSNIKISYDRMQYNNDPDPKKIYDVSIDTDAEFDLGIDLEYKGKSACQLVTHAYELIKDCEVQSYYDLGFGGYMHFVHFNTSIPIDKIYRVDVSYVLTNSNNDLDDKRVIKSMTPDKKSTGIFCLYTTYGFKEGTFKSNEKDSITYKYEMQLNYKDQNWDLFGDKCIESNYKRISDFKVLRLNYLISDKVYDVKVSMDTIEGETKSIVDRDLILDTNSALYNVKDVGYSIMDGIENAFKFTKNFVGALLAITVFVFIFYGGYKMVIYVKEVLKDDSKT